MKTYKKENVVKRLSEMEYALANSTSQVLMENSTVRRLEEEKSVLKKEMEAARMQVLGLATNLWKALFGDQDALKRDQSRATEKNLLLEGVPTDEGKVAELQWEVEKAEGLCKQIEGKKFS